MHYAVTAKQLTKWCLVLSVLIDHQALFLLVIGASGLYTPGPVRLDSVHRPPALFLLQGIHQAAPAQVTAYRVVTVTWLCNIFLLKTQLANPLEKRLLILNSYSSYITKEFI